MFRSFRNIGVASILFLSYLNSACQTVRYKFGNEPNGAGDEVVHSNWILGLVEQKQLKIKNYCSNSVSKIISERSWFNFIPYLNYIWVPRSVSIDCSDVAMTSNPGAGSGSQGSPNQNINNNINIQISPELLKKP